MPKITKSNIAKFFQIILSCIILHFNKEILSDFEIKILFFQFSNK